MLFTLNYFTNNYNMISIAYKKIRKNYHIYAT